MSSKQRDFIIERFGTWGITDFGIQHLGKFPYFVGKERLGESGWCRHIARKAWADVKTFQKALLFARKYFGIRKPRFGDWSSRYWIPPDGGRKR